MMKVPLGDMSGKSPMKTVWLLISPVLLLMNSAVTNMGAEYVMSLSLHSSTEYLGGSKRWSRNDSDMVPVKSSIGLISSKISSSPDCSGTSLSPAFLAVSMRSSQRSFPSSQSNDSVCRASSPETSSGSLMRAKEIRRVAEAVAEALRDAANRGPSRVHANFHRTHAKRPADTPREVRVCRGRKSAAQISSVVTSYTACQVYLTMRFTVLRSMAGSGRNVKSTAASEANLSNVTNATPGTRCGGQASRVKLSVPSRRRPHDGRVARDDVCPASIRDAGRAHAGAG